MLTKRIIPCLDVKDSRVVKGQSFVNLRDAGDPIQLASFYDQEGADELVFLDISASLEKRKTMIEMVRKTAESISITFTVGGGITTTDEIKDLLRAGADKVSLNSSAVKNPQLIQDAAKIFGSQCIVLAVDAKRVEAPEASASGASSSSESASSQPYWEVFTHGGTQSTGKNVLEWVQEGVKLGAGEILLTSMDCDGQKEGFDLELNKAVCNAVNVPVIASGGAGTMEDFLHVFTKTKVDAGLAASIFHYGEIKIKDLKAYLKNQGVDVRC